MVQLSGDLILDDTSNRNVFKGTLVNWFCAIIEKSVSAQRDLGSLMFQREQLDKFLMICIFGGNPILYMLLL